MSFRKRNVVVTSPGVNSPTAGIRSIENILAPGARPSPLDGRLTTSTGTRSLDALLAGHAGLALGTSLFIGESGTTDFGGALLRYYAAEGVVHGHHVHVLGTHEGWARELPGLAVGGENGSKKAPKQGNEDKMKIAWRYERLGEFGKDRAVAAPVSSSTTAPATIFCHDFDLSKRLVIPSPSTLRCLPISISHPFQSLQPSETRNSPFAGFLQHLRNQVLSMPPTAIHRIIVPNMLSPAVYPPDAARPEFVLQFLHSLRALLRKYPSQLTAMITVPLSLFPRHTGLTRWIEILNDGVLEIAPFPSNTLPVASSSAGSSSTQEDPPQGMLKIHRLPIFHEKGGGGGESGAGDDMAFSLSRRKGLVIKPYSLPPVESDSDAQDQAGLATDTGGKATKVDIEF